MIERLLFWFSDGEEKLYEYTKRFFPLAMLLNRLLIESYDGKKVKFLNLRFYTQRSYEAYEKLVPNYTHSYGGHTHHNALFNRREFEALTIQEQKVLIWERACELLKVIASDTKNTALGVSAGTAFYKGVETGLDEDFVMRSASFQMNGHSIVVDIWAHFVEGMVKSILSVRSDDRLILEKELDRTESDVEFFYTMYKNITLDRENNIVVKGHYSVDYLPLTVPIIDKLKQSSLTTPLR
jgi:hypothetical protein